MTVEEDLLGRVIEILEQLAIPYMVTGSVASSYHGRPRATHDADVVIDPTTEHLESLVKALEAAGFYVPHERAREALRDRRQFNAIETTHATKVDLIIRKTRPFSVEEFHRRERVDTLFRPQVAMVSREDAILTKLEWARRSGDSERQIRDAAGVLELNPGLDRDYIRYWAERLGVGDLWRQLLSQTTG